jgi:hypothetical protein
MDNARLPKGQRGDPDGGALRGEEKADDTPKTQGVAGSKHGQRDPRRSVVGGLLLVVAAGCLIWLILDRSLPLWAIALLAVAAAAAAGAFARFFLPHQLSPGTKRFIIVAVTCLTLIIGLLAIPLSNSEPKPPNGKQSTEPSSSPPSHTPSTPTEELFDDFNGDLNLNKWTLTRLQGSDQEQLPHQIYTKDGRLNLEVSPSNSAAGVNVEVRAKLPPDRTIKKISMKMALVSQKGGSDGATYLIVSSAKGRENRLWMGPNGDNEPTLGYYICENEKSLCHQRKESNTDQQYPLEKGREFMVEAVADPDRDLHLDVIDHSSALAPGGAPIKSFKFYLFSDPGRSFRVTVDGVWITYN